jgi:hypothetical protein
MDRLTSSCSRDTMSTENQRFSNSQCSFPRSSPITAITYAVKCMLIVSRYNAESRLNPPPAACMHTII